MRYSPVSCSRSCFEMILPYSPPFQLLDGRCRALSSVHSLLKPCLRCRPWSSRGLVNSLRATSLRLRSPWLNNTLRVSAFPPNNRICVPHLFVLLVLLHCRSISQRQQHQKLHRRRVFSPEVAESGRHVARSARGSARNTKPWVPARRFFDAVSFLSIRPVMLR